jgi:hypothetical protein
MESQFQTKQVYLSTLQCSVKHCLLESRLGNSFRGAISVLFPTDLVGLYIP